MVRVVGGQICHTVTLQAQMYGQYGRGTNVSHSKHRGMVSMVGGQISHTVTLQVLRYGQYGRGTNMSHIIIIDQHCEVSNGRAQSARGKSEREA